jgi:hypothetical protein
MIPPIRPKETRLAGSRASRMGGVASIGHSTGRVAKIFSVLLHRFYRCTKRLGFSKRPERYLAGFALRLPLLYA